MHVFPRSREFAFLYLEFWLAVAIIMIGFTTPNRKALYFDVINPPIGLFHRLRFENASPHSICKGNHMIWEQFGINKSE